MTIGLRIAIVLLCAYAGWQTAIVQFAELPVSQQPAQQIAVTAY
jgi:hypothetical protein